MKIVKAIMIGTIVFGLFLNPNAHADFNLTLQDIELEPGITADIHVVVFENNSGFCQQQNPISINAFSIFAVHGILTSAFVWGPLANTLFINNPTGGIVCRVVAIDLPGHGLSGLPQGGLLFGQMSEDNYANVVINSLTELSQVHSINPISYMAHSNGGLVTQLVQQKLSQSDSTLSSEFGIEKLTLIASAITAPVPWPFLQPIVDLDALEVGCFFNFGFSPDCTTIDLVAPFGVINWDDILAVANSPLNPNGIIPVYDCDPDTVPIGGPIGAPTQLPAPPMPPCESITVLGDRAPVGSLGLPDPEPLMVLREGPGLPPQVRPVTSPDIFGGITRATFQMAAMELDELIGPPEQLEVLFAHLTTGENSAFTIIGGPNSFHGMFFFNPEEFLDGLVEGGICLIPLAVARPIPTLSEWGLIAMVGLLGIAGFIALRRRYTTV